MSNRFIAFRQRAIDWLNGKRDFNEGISILKESGFKPGVVNKLSRQGVEGPMAASRLTYLMRELVKAWAMPEEQLQDNLDSQEGAPADAQLMLTDGTELKKISETMNEVMSENNPHPTNISKAIRLYADAYKRRDMLHRKMTELPESNEEAVIAERKKITEEIGRCTDLMERLYPLYGQYLQSGKDVTDEQVEKASDSNESDEEDDEDTTSSDYESCSLEELKKLRKSVSTKILRAKNLIEYQQETKADKPNPLPPSPKREKYELKISRLSAELERIDYAIVRMG